MGYREEGVTLKLYVSESGDFVSVGTRTDYPFNPGGTYGVPAGFTPYLPNGNLDMSISTSSLGRFSISNGSTTDAKGNYVYGARLSFPIVKDTRYIMNLQAQVMEGKQAAKRMIVQANSGSSWGTTLTAVTPWEDMALYGNFEAANDTMTVTFGATNQDATVFNWGVQFQHLSITAIPLHPPVPVWHEVTCEVKSLQTRWGRERVTNRYDVGTASIGILNDDGEFTYRLNHPWGLRPGRFVKVEAQVAGYAGTYPVYYGIIDGFTDSYTLDGHALQVMNCVDISSLLSNMTVPSMSDPSIIVYSGTRWKQVLNGVGWHPDQTIYDTGIFGQQGIVNNGRTVRDELGLGADSEGSYFFADRSGNLVYRARDWTTWEPNGNTVQAELLAEPEGEPSISHAVEFIYPRVAGNYMSTPNQAALNPLNDLTITARISVANWAQGGRIVAKQSSTAGASSTFWLTQNGNATTHSFAIWVGQGATNSPNTIPFGNNQPFWLKVTYVKSTGLVTFYYAQDSASEPPAGSFTAAGAGYPAGSLGQVASTGPLTIASDFAGNTPFGGRIAAVKVQGDGGALLFDMSEANAATTPGALAFTASSGHAMTVHQTGANVIIQDAATIELLPPVDGIPTSASAPLVCTNELTTSWSRDRVVNEVSLANQGGSARSAIDNDSQQKYGPRTYQRMDLINDNAHPEYIDTRMNDLLDGYTEAVLRVNTIRFRPMGTPAVQWALRAFLNDLVRVRYTNSREHWGYAVVSHIQGIEHSFSLTEWSVSLMLDDPESFTYFVEGGVTSGWDTGLWDEDIWDGAGDPSTPAYWNAGYSWSDPDSKWG